MTEKKVSEMGKVVCVTGASGYLASWLVKFLLHRGYTVKATVRNLSDPKKVAHLKALDGAAERLHLFEANLIEDGSFDSVIDGCEGVFHTASPVFLKVTDPQTELIDPAVKGVLNVLRSCKKVASVKRVVITSSLASVINAKPLKPDVIVDETWFSDPVFCKEKNKWYSLSKTLAEEAARKFAKENSIDLVVMNPGFVTGPLLQPTINATSEGFWDFVQGKKDFESYQSVDVRDVAYAHILAFENPSASGRYCLVGTALTRFKALEILHKLYPSLNLPKIDAGEPTYQVSKKRAESLGIVFTPVEVSLKDMVESLKEKKFITGNIASNN